MLKSNSGITTSNKTIKMNKNEHKSFFIARKKKLELLQSADFGMVLLITKKKQFT